MKSILLLLIPVFLGAGVIDRVAVVVGKTVITESEIDENLRLTAMLNGEPVNVTPQNRRAAAERLVDQELLRKEMQAGANQPPTSAEGDKLLQQYSREHPNYRAELAKYGVSEADLKNELLWQLQVMRFTDYRFGNQLPGSTVQSADRSAGEPASGGQSVDQQLEAWLKQARENAKVVFKAEAFQ